MNTRHRRTEFLPFVIQVARTDEQLKQAVSIRQSAYARHVPQLAATLGEIEPADRDPNAVVLLATDKETGNPIGTMRIQTNLEHPLLLEHSVELPARFQGRLLAEATRLGVALGRQGSLVKTMLFKAFYLHCLNEEVAYMVVAGRSPVDRIYRGLLFEDVFPGMGFVPMAHAGNIPHRVMAFEMLRAERLWAAANHPMYNTIVLTHHPDLLLDERGVEEGPAAEVSSSALLVG